MRKLETSALRAEINTLKAGESVLLSGVIYTARDAAHARICSILNLGGELPFSLENAVIYYAGPTPAPDGLPIGSCGPTTSARMDAFTPSLIENGLVATIGKGNRGDDVISTMKKHGSVYFCAVGGAGAIAAKCVKKSEIIAFAELGCEAVRRLEIEDFPLIVGIDAEGNSILQ